MIRLIDDGQHRCETRTIIQFVLDYYGCCDIQVDPDLLYPPRFNLVTSPNQQKICSIYLDRPEYCVGSPVLTEDEKEQLVEVLKCCWRTAFERWILMSDLGPCKVDSTYTNIEIPDEMPDYSKLPNKPNGEIRVWTHPLFNIDGYENDILVYIVFTENKHIYLDVGFKGKEVYRWMTVAIDEPKYIGKHDRISAKDKAKFNEFMDKYWLKITKIIDAELTYPCQWYDDTSDVTPVRCVHPNYNKLGKKELGWIYDKDVCMSDVRCDSYPIFVKDDYVAFIAILSQADEYYTIVGIKDNEQSDERDWFAISMERPVYIQEPPRNLTKKEKEILQKYAVKKWLELVSTMKIQCNIDCILQVEGGGCDKFRNRPIPITPPDYTLLPNF